MKKNPTLTASRIRTALFSMRSAGIVSVNDVFCPLIPHLKVYTLTEMGQRLYKSKFGNVAKMSESEKVIAEHDNLSHGYGILSVAEVIRQSNQFDSVTTNRKVNTIHLHNGIEYIPDIVCKTDKTTIYVEYEMGTHTQTDFNNKCGKMLMASKNLYFVVPNQDVLRESMVPKIQKWVDSKSKQVLSGAKIYLTTAQNLSQCNFSDDSTWRILFDLNKSNKPQEQGM